MYEPESDNETENIEEDTPESEFEEIEEEHEKNEQSLQYKTKKKATQQIGEKRKLKITGTLELVYQIMLEDIDKKEQPALISYKDMENLEFQILLTNNYYTNPNSIHICFPSKLKKLPMKLMTQTLT